MRRLHPEPAREVDAGVVHFEASRSAGGDRPWVMLNMVTSVDGATAAKGRSGELGGDGDREVFHAIRAVPDVIVAGAATVRAERYGPPRISEDTMRARVARGQSAVPDIAVVTASLDLDVALPLFADDHTSPIVATTASADSARVEHLEANGARIVVAGEDRVEVGLLVSELAALGHRIVLLEGGPRLNAQFIAAGLLDEVNVTLSPHLIAGSSARLAVGEEEVFDELGLAHVLEQDGSLFCRYVRVPV